MFLIDLIDNMRLIWLADATVYVGGLDEKVSESLLWELFVQAGPVGMKIFVKTTKCCLNYLMLKYFTF